MPFSKGEIISFQFKEPKTGKLLEHPGVIISCDEVYAHDKCYVCAMMSSNGKKDRFSFPLTNVDLIKPNNKTNSQVRCHLITYVLESDLKQSNPYNKLTKQAFERLIAHISVFVFDV